MDSVEAGAGFRMKILLCTFGSHGDIHPYLALGHELRSRGHRVTLATSEHYRALIGDHGLGFLAVRPDLHGDDTAAMQRIMDPKRGGEFLIRQLLMPVVADTYADLIGPAAEADLLVSHVLAFAIPIVAEQLGKPWVSVALSPMVFFSAHEVPALAPLPGVARLRGLGPRLNRWLFRLPRWVSRNWSRPAYRLRRELGLPPGPDPLWEGLHSPHLGLAMFSARFGAPQPDWPANTAVTGFPFLDSPDEPAGPEVEPFLAAGEAPLVFTLGSAAVRVAGDFYEVAARVSRRLGCRAVLVTGAGADALRPNLPPNCVTTGWASYPGLFSRAAAVVHQGGVGTTAQALRAGVPQLVVPFAHDQFDNADRIRRMGCGRVLFRSRVTDTTLAREIAALLADPQVPARARAEREAIRAEAGAAAAADEITRRFP